MPLAQVITDYSIFMQYGAIGVVLMWFMFRVEKRLDDHTSVISDLARSILLDVLSRDSLSDALRHEATEVMNRVAQRDTSRKR